MPNMDVNTRLLNNWAKLSIVIAARPASELQYLRDSKRENE